MPPAVVFIRVHRGPQAGPAECGDGLCPPAEDRGSQAVCGSDVTARMPPSPAALGEAEVGQLDVEVLVEEQVLALEVPVDDVQVVAVLDGQGELVELLASIVFAQGSPAFDEVEEVALDPELHDDVDLAL
uniref:Uncharacterized protein n=1 Tax=Myotis myotis TaxID=51298 RepID=A0A7J7V3I7_MYOMY|nr:hypothetical protein mMyoMyo1_008412 [Myotis myotis]